MENAAPVLSKKENILRIVLWGVLEAFAIASLICMVIDGNVMKVLMSIFTMLLLALPFTASKLFHFEMNTVFFIFCELYAIGPMLGHVYNLYYHTTWWDDVLHTAGGVVFAIFGVYLAQFVSKDKEPSILMKAIFRRWSVLVKSASTTPGKSSLSPKMYLEKWMHRAVIGFP